MNTPNEKQAMSDIHLKAQPGPPPTGQTQNFKLVCLEYGEGQSPKTELCPTCDSTVWTSVTTSTTTLGYVWFCLCYCICCVCSLLPFYLNTFKKYYHFCPNCGALLKTVSPSFSTCKIILIIISFILAFIGYLLVIYIGLKYLGLV
eukprot:TRINITY_DN56383_c0_g1_i1.p1 TRINITY_DN56383_c0_g1~~TRINITY_DN56383_c0_g1_i1.p1  ORF type:complete len:146 (-),score=30.37 TRINITY_DN56383_c0_g1_i1:69-506(-)